jgi:CDP-diacylglycerol--glycerol-3-phosphate 3-phosphatidyltransferase
MIAALTDWLDGYLARSTNSESAFGAFLDPVADKFLVITAMVLLVDRYHAWEITVPGILIISREIFIMSLREWAAKSSSVVPVSKMGKLKTGFQMVALILLLSFEYTTIIGKIGYMCLLISLFFSSYSMFNYLKSVRSALTFGIKQE